jgi:phage terminase large subunit-like protein
MAYALVARFPDGIDTDGRPKWRYETLTRCYIDVDTNRNLNESPWAEWVQTKRLRVCGDLYATVKEELTKDMRQFKVRQVAFDPWNMQQMGEELHRAGFDVIKVPQQRYTMHEPTSLLLDLIRRKKITHDGKDSLLRWSIGNLVLDVDSDNRWKPSKKKSGDKIDPVVALIMALRQCSLAPQRSRGSLFVA